MLSISEESHASGKDNVGAQFIGASPIYRPLVGVSISRFIRLCALSRPPPTYRPYG